MQLSGVNSINFARVLAQVVYYFKAYFAATRTNDEQVTFAVQVTNRGTSAAGASVTRVAVGGSTLNANTGAINAGQTVTVEAMDR